MGRCPRAISSATKRKALLRPGGWPVAGSAAAPEWRRGLASHWRLSNCSVHIRVFFLDEDQQVAWKDISTEVEIREYASALGAEVITNELPSQFRCAGSDGYLGWLDDLLGIRPSANSELDTGAVDLRLFNDPVSLYAAIREANGSNRTRVVADYCWNWEPKKNQTLKTS